MDAGARGGLGATVPPHLSLYAPWHVLYIESLCVYAGNFLYDFISPCILCGLCKGSSFVGALLCPLYRIQPDRVAFTEVTPELKIGRAKTVNVTHHV